MRTTALVGFGLISTVLLVQFGPRLWRSVAYRVLERSPVAAPSVGPEDVPLGVESVVATEYVVLESRLTGETFGEFRDAAGDPIGIRILPKGSVTARASRAPDPASLPGAPSALDPSTSGESPSGY